MKLLKEKYDGLQDIDELSFELMNFLSEPDVQQALQKSNFDAIYRRIHTEFAGEFTQLINSLNIDPLDYLNYIPEYFLAHTTTIKSITIPSHINKIGSYAFEECIRLTSITIPDSVTSIGSGAFYECSELNDIKYTGTKEQWDNIKLGKLWNRKSAIKTIHCIDGDINL